MTAAQRKRSRPSTSVRLEAFLALEDAHPYGCLPGGNRFFVRNDDDPNGESSKENGGASSSFSSTTAGTKETEWMSDSLWQSVLGFCDAQTLSRVVQSSRYLYVAGHQPELWRDLVLRRCDEENRVIDCTNNNTSSNNNCNNEKDKEGPTMKSWRDTYVCLFVKNASFMRSHKPLSIPGVYSDEYYRTHRCRSFALPDAWLDPETTAVEDNFPCVSMDAITPESFLQDFEAKNCPVVIKGAAQSTRALQNWQEPTYLRSCNVSGKTFRTTSGAAPLPVNFTLEAYQSYSQFDYLEESPLYLFDRTALDNPLWHDDFFPQFYEACPWWDPSAKYGHDLLQHLGAAERPDHTWLIMGPKRSGSVFHIDPNATHAWNVCIQGRKRWIFYPPGCPPPGVFPSEDGDEVAIPLSVGEWLLQYWPEHLQRYKKRDPNERPMECTVFPGDVVFVPHGWWHMVINLDDHNCAITHNYVSPSNLGNVLKFFTAKQDQISGCRDRVETIKPEHLHDALVEALANVEPKYLQKAQQQEGWTCRAWKEELESSSSSTTKKVDEKNNNKRLRTNADEPELTKEGGTSVMAKTEKVAAFSFSFL